MPFLRYRLGDRGRLETSPCPCGRPSPRLFFSGRAAQFVALKEGGRTPLLAVVEIIRNCAPVILQFQFEQDQPGELAVRLAVSREFTPEVLDRIAAAVGERFSGRLELKVSVSSSIPGKSVLFSGALSRQGGR
jgi:phenylacetate-CoA ligase